MKFTFYGHSCFSVVINGKIILFDPFITKNDLAKNIDVTNITADYIVVSHGHFDHTDDVELLAKQTNATIISNWEICTWYQKKGITNVHPMNTGGSFHFDFGTIKAVNAVHSSSMSDGSYGGNPLGFILNNGTESFYYSGDTALTLDMQLIGNATNLNFAILPIGNNFTMGIADAIQASKFIKCNTIVGVHYDTFGYIVIDKEKAKEEFDKNGIKLLLLEIGETVEL